MYVPGSVQEGGSCGGAAEGAAEVRQALIRRLPAKTPRTQVDRIDAPLNRPHREAEVKGRRRRPEADISSHVEMHNVYTVCSQEQEERKGLG